MKTATGVVSLFCHALEKSREVVFSGSSSRWYNQNVKEMLAVARIRGQKFKTIANRIILPIGVARKKPVWYKISAYFKIILFAFIVL